VLIQMRKDVPEIEQATHATSFTHLNRAAMRIFFSQHDEFGPRDTERHIFFVESLITSILGRFVIERPRFLSRQQVLNQVCDLVSMYLKANQRLE
jgi:Tetracyclin repressor-like, C-terminal domain